MRLHGTKSAFEGFTLLELLLSIAIFAIVVSITYGAYSMTFRVVNNANSNSQFAEKARIVFERMRDDLESFYGGETTVFTGESKTYGEYRGDELEFTSTAHIIFHKDQLSHGKTTISYTVEENEQKNELKLFRADTVSLPGTTPDDEKGLLLCDGLREVAFTYTDKEGSESEEWNETTGGDKSLPRLVSIKLGFPDEENEEETVAYSISVALPVMD